MSIECGLNKNGDGIEFKLKSICIKPNYQHV